MTTEALAIIEQPQSTAIITREALRMQSDQRALLSEYVQKQMKEGTDYGVIPGTKDKTLFKSGAEKLVDLFRCTPKFKLMDKVEDFDRGLFAYTFRVQLYQRDAGAVLAEGYGSCNSREERYRYRKGGRKCPKCNAESIIAGKEQYGGGWLCFAKKGGCGAKFSKGDKTIESQESGRVENADIATLANTLLKMAKKRALVDGAIALARVSDLFTQDVEDFTEAEIVRDPPRAEAYSGSVPDEVQPPPAAPPPAEPSPVAMTAAQHLRAAGATPREDTDQSAAVWLMEHFAAGFDNDFHRDGARKKYRPAINMLPKPLRAQVVKAFDESKIKSATAEGSAA